MPSRPILRSIWRYFFYIPVSVGQTQFYRRHIELVALEPVHLYAELAETPDEGSIIDNIIVSKILPDA